MVSPNSAGDIGYSAATDVDVISLEDIVDPDCEVSPSKCEDRGIKLQLRQLVILEYVNS